MILRIVKKLAGSYHIPSTRGSFKRRLSHEERRRERGFKLGKDAHFPLEFGFTCTKCGGELYREVVEESVEDLASCTGCGSEYRLELIYEDKSEVWQSDKENTGDKSEA